MPDSSRPHQEFCLKVLERLQIGYKMEEPMGPYSLDCYLPEWHICIEVDGPNHTPRGDAKRDGILLEHYGVPVLHVSIDRLRIADRPRLLLDVIDFIELWADSATERRRKWQQPKQI